MAQSLKQLIAVNAAELGVVQNKLSLLTDGDVDLSARITANADLIAANQATLQTLTATADGTASTLAEATNGFNIALTDLENRAYAADELVRIAADEGIALVRTEVDDERTRAEANEQELYSGFTQEVARAEAAEAAIRATATTDRNAAVSRDAQNAYDIDIEKTRAKAAESTEKTRAEAAEAALGGRIDTEEVARANAITALDNARLADKAVSLAGDVSLNTRVDEAKSQATAATAAEKTRAEAAEVALGGRIDGEASTRISAIASEATARGSAIASEASARAAGDAKMCFAHVMEFDGTLVAGEYPFSHGAGVPSAAGFGVQIPMDYRLVGYGIECKLTSAFNFVLELEGYKVGASIVDWAKLVNVSGGRSYNLLSSEPIKNGGQVCVKVNSLAAGAAPASSDRFRVTLYFQSAYGF
jgi:hypothetical protein